MTRTRAAVLQAAADCLIARGVRGTTMGLVATTAGVAKATLYNHVRDKDDLLASLAAERAAVLGRACLSAGGPAAALELAAGRLAADPLLQALREGEPEVLLPLTAPGPGPAWASARVAVGALLAGPDAAQVEAVLRWLVGQLLWPVGPSQARYDAALLTCAATPAAPGLGWPVTAPYR